MPVVMTKTQYEKTLDFFKFIPNVEILPCDEPIEGITGSLIYYMNPNTKEEKQLYVAQRYAKPIPYHQRDPFTKEDLENKEVKELVEFQSGIHMSLRDFLLDKIKKCITEEGWKQCDDPKNMVIGFAKYEYEDKGNIYNHNESNGLFLKVDAYKSLPNDLRKEVEEWRSKQNENG